VSAKLSGQCSCGGVTYEITGEPLFVQACHCTDCQRTTGSAFVVHIVIPESELRIRGRTTMSIAPTGSGQGCELHYCTTCAVFVWVRYLYQQVRAIAVRAGTLNDTNAVAPQAHIFVRSKQEWVLIPPDIPTFEGAADRSVIWPPESIARYDALPERT